jgi:uncharacterized membrane protein YdbT with pleckstrin-like domain
MNEETPVWEGRPSQVVNLPHFVGGSVAAIALALIFPPLIGLPVGHMLWRYLVVHNTHYVLTSQRLVTHSGVLNKHTDEVELYRVRDLQQQQPFMYRIFGLGHVAVVSSDTLTPVVPIIAQPNSTELRTMVRNAVEKRRAEKGIRVAEVD